MKWVEPPPVEVPAELQAAVGGHPLVAKALVERGLSTPHAALAFLDPAYYRPSSPLELPDMAAAVERLQSAIARGERILVWGDFDVDGLTATALLVEALRALGAQVDWYIPDRRTESHGVHWRSLQPFLGRGVRVLLTCDTGISAHEVVALAQHAGLDVLITDHHALPPTLPQAQAIVNPRRLPSEHPLYHLSGVGVAYKLAEALGVGEKGLDLVVLGLVADVVPLQGEVRYLVQRGLQMLRQVRRVGLQALLEVAEIGPDALDEDQISYALAPRLNALGRMTDASVGVELFLTEDLARARVIAAEMEAWNVRRQFLSQQVFVAAQEQIEKDRSLLSQPVLVLSHPQWPTGVLGIAAGRLAERYNRPVVLLSAPPGGMARASARSVPGVDLYAALAAHSRLLASFGGHPMAAGFSIALDRIPELRRLLVETVAAQIGVLPPERELPIATYLSLPDLTLELLDEVARLAPFGPGNPPLYLASRRLRVTAERTIGRIGEHRRLEVQDEEGHALPAVWWQSADLPVPEGLFDLAYVLRAGNFARERTLYLEWIDAHIVEKPVVERIVPTIAIAVADYRTVKEPLPILQALWEEGTMALWAEAVAVPGFPAHGRSDLQPNSILVVWTIPPGPRVWKQVLHRVQPSQVFLFGVDPGLDTVDAFLRRLTGLVKHALSAYNGKLNWEALATAMAHCEETVQAGVRWLMAHGLVSPVTQQGDILIVEGGGHTDEAAERRVRRELEELLHETAAYRAYFREADARRLVAWDML
ncbi:MAG: single-stranded-DNA-specific exonuclease RecJ [Chloroflexi bacterium]|nr:single-stranded-DNA-specific exonuclease RecJ [Chloroflexota bacterium]